MITAPPAPLPRLCLGVTGHRAGNAHFVSNQAAVAEAIARLFGQIDHLVETEAATLGPHAPVRLHNLLACGVDQLSCSVARQRGWELVAPLPFGRQLNLAINALPASLADARALLDGADPTDPETAQRAATISYWYENARVFELAERDDAIAPLYLDHLASPADFALAQRFTAQGSDRAALAGMVMIEQSDLIVAVWDGQHSNLVGGTGHTIAVALDQGVPVVWLDPGNCKGWYVLTAPEMLIARSGLQPASEDQLAAVIRQALRPGEGGALRHGAGVLASEAWHPTSSPLGSVYRRIEAVFGGEPRPWRSLSVRYERPDEIGSGSAAPVLDLAHKLLGKDPGFLGGLQRATFARFAWADGISSRLADGYRSGMVANFLLSALAVAVGLIYQPLKLDGDKWIFALGEFLLLCTIVGITWVGRRRRWHKRWFETRRVAEYFRHAPLLQVLGVARPAGLWPRGSDTSWPEYYARHGLRELGLPGVAVDTAYLNRGLAGLLELHVLPQRDYHLAKAKRLTTVHHRLDRLSMRLFFLALLSVSSWLVIAAFARMGLVPHDLPHTLGKYSTFFGVLCPMLGASIAGIRYFGDFERFAAISEVTATKLDAISQRIATLIDAAGKETSFAEIADLAHAVDRVVVDEIENWQAVFSGKDIAIPI